MLPVFRKLVCKPRVDDWSPLAKFYYADEALQAVTAELDSFDGRKDPDRCAQLISQLRQCQDHVLQIIDEMLQEIGALDSSFRASRDYRVKFPDDIITESLAGQLWFGAECLAAGSNIIDHEFESEALRPLAKSFSVQLDDLRETLKDQSLRNPGVYTEKVKQTLRAFDFVFAEFELNYVSTMVNVKSVKEYDAQLDVSVLLSETLTRALSRGYITSDQVAECEPSIMITLPRLAIVCGLLIHPDGPLNLDKEPENLSEMFRPFQTLLAKIRDLLRTLSESELSVLERALSNQEEPTFEECDVTLMSDYRWTQRQYAKNLKQAALANQNPKVVLKGESKPPAIVSSNEDDNGIESGDAANTMTPLSNNVASASSGEGKISTSSSSSSCSEISVRITVHSNSQLSEKDCGQHANCQRRPASDCVPDVEIVYSDLSSTPLLPSPAAPSMSSLAPQQQTERVVEITSSASGLNLDDQKQAESNRGLDNKLRARFRSTNDLIHRLFVCISGVADQLQSNYPSDLRAVLKVVLHPQEPFEVFEITGRPAVGAGPEEETGVEIIEGVGSNGGSSTGPTLTGVPWVPDKECLHCDACKAQFTLVRRRHHCRSCGRIFCQRCSGNSLPLPEIGYSKAVRVCDRCFLYKVNPFTPATTSVATH